MKSFLDVDECAEGTHDCNTATHDCINNAEGYTCKRVRCEKGYKMVDDQCIGKISSIISSIYFIFIYFYLSFLFQNGKLFLTNFQFALCTFEKFTKKGQYGTHSFVVYPH